MTTEIKLLLTFYSQPADFFSTLSYLVLQKTSIQYRRRFVSREYCSPTHIKTKFTQNSLTRNYARKTTVFVIQNHKPTLCTG